jgi:hypothetical protein
VKRRMVREDDHSTQNPREGVIRQMLEPIVLGTEEP